MTTTEPFVPHPDDHDSDQAGVPAADVGVGGPEPAPGFGVEGEEPDRVAAEPSAGLDPSGVDTPFRRPEAT